MIVNFYFHSLLIIKITKTKAEHEILQIRSIEKRNIKYDDVCYRFQYSECIENK